MFRCQRTLQERVEFEGVGLHTGYPVRLAILPAPPDTGIRFRRTDLRNFEIEAVRAHVAKVSYATTLMKKGVMIATVEHVLSTLYGLGIDNVRVEVDGPEVPGMDGSAASFVHLLRAAGLFEQAAFRRVLRVRRPLEIRDGERWIRIEPALGLRISYAIDFAHPLIGRQQLHGLVLDEEGFDRELSRARTFGFAEQVEALWRSGRARGASLDNTVVLGADRVLNRDGLRWPDEFVRHKALDLVGDLALLGVRVQGHIRVERGGHALHQRLVAALASLMAAERLPLDAPVRPASPIALPGAISSL